jgi:hypothetical protein
VRPAIHTERSINGHHRSPDSDHLDHYHRQGSWRILTTPSSKLGFGI